MKDVELLGFAEVGGRYDMANFGAVRARRPVDPRQEASVYRQE